MNKTLLTLILVFSTAILFAQKEEYRREINKDFSVSANAQLSISNIFGNVNIVEGSEGKIVFKIEIKGKGKNVEIAKEYAEGVNVDFTSDGNHVSAKTNLPKINCSNCGISIDYVVIVPLSATMDFDIKYGNLTLKDTPKPLTVKIMYGDIKANIIADANLNVQYGDVKFEKCNKLTASVMYGDFTSTSISEADIDTKYGSVTFSTCGLTKINSIYSDIKADVTGNTNIDVKYGDVAIGKCSNLKFKSLYADLKSNSIADADINIGYADVTIGACKDLLLKSLYTKFKIGEIASIKANSQYDDFKITTITDFTITTIYTDISIDNLNRSFAASKFTYGDLTIKNIAKDFSKITADNGMYSHFKLGLTEQHEFKANISAGEYGDIDAGKIKFNNVTVSKTKNTIVGVAGKSANPKAEVKISASYGDIIFNK
ncbi:MAG: hypothetical protein LBP63_08505 [Prevotellaceae bacterium]|jgi:hypothetical protein|nr:hypothetical protein [Prevotellaceae bacterium]